MKVLEAKIGEEIFILPFGRQGNLAKSTIDREQAWIFKLEWRGWDIGPKTEYDSSIYRCSCRCRRLQDLLAGTYVMRLKAVGVEWYVSKTWAGRIFSQTHMAEVRLEARKWQSSDVQLKRNGRRRWNTVKGWCAGAISVRWVTFCHSWIDQWLWCSL